MRTLEKGTWLKAKDGSNFAKFYYYESEEIKNAKGQGKKSETPTSFFRANDDTRGLPLVCERVRGLRLDEYEEASDAEKTLLESLYRVKLEIKQHEWEWINEKNRIRTILRDIDAKVAEEAFSALDEASDAVDEISKRIDDAVKLTGQKYISADLINQGIQEAGKRMGKASASVYRLKTVLKKAWEIGAEGVSEHYSPMPF